MDFIVTPWLLVQGIKLIGAPVGEAGWQQFTEDMGKRIGSGAADLVADWLRRAALPASADAPRSAELVREMEQRPEIASELGAEVGRRLGMEVSPSEGPPPGTDLPRDQVVLESYESVFWRLAVLAFIEDRPIAVQGALQGPDWITVCVPLGGLAIGTPKPPKPDDVWIYRRHRRMLQRRDQWGRAAFFIKAVASGQASHEVAALDRSFRITGDTGFPPESKEAPLRDRWHRLNGLASLWVQLEPDSDARKWIIEQGVDDIEDVDYPGYDKYPSEWSRLLDIPSEIEGVTLLDRGADAFAAESASVRERFSRYRSEGTNPE